MFQLYKNEFYLKNPDVLILIEHIVRELEVACLLKVALEKKGLNVRIDTVNFNKERLPLIYKPKIVILPWLYNDIEMDVFRFFKDENSMSSYIINMHHEPITNKDSEEFIIPKGAAKDVYHLCWGREFKNLLKNNGCKEETLLEFGSPRQDFYFGELQGISRCRKSLSEDFSLDLDKRWFLFVANSFHLHTDKQKEYYASIGVDVYGIGKVGAENTYHFFDYVDNYLSNNMDVEFIYRPHPSGVMLEENIKQHKILQEKHKNYHVIFDGAIRDWIINVEGLIFQIPRLLPLESHHLKHQRTMMHL